MLSISSITMMNSFQYPRTIDARFVISLPALFSSLFGLSGDYDENTYNVEFKASDLNIPSFTNFPLKGAFIEKDTISSAQENNSQLLGPLYLQRVKFKSKTNDAEVKFNLEDQVLGNKIAQMVFKSSISSSILNKNSISVIARDIGSFKNVQDIRSSQLAVERINWSSLESDILKIKIQFIYKFYSTLQKIVTTRDQIYYMKCFRIYLQCLRSDIYC